MATDPIYGSIPNNGAALLGAAETSLTVPTTTSVVYTPGAAGGKIEEVVVTAIATTVAGMVYVFRFDGANYWLHDIIPVTAVTVSATQQPFRVSQRYSNLFLKAGGSLRMSQSIAGNANLLVANVYGGDF